MNVRKNDDSLKIVKNPYDSEILDIFRQFQYIFRNVRCHFVRFYAFLGILFLTFFLILVIFENFKCFSNLFRILQYVLPRRNILKFRLYRLDRALEKD